MKKLILYIIFCIGIAGMANAQSQQITFVPGLGENSNVWLGMSNQLQQDGYTFSDNFIFFNGSNAISSSAASAYIPNNDVVIAHSEGGLLSREYLRQKGSNSFNALITVGTPNKGAPIINSVLDGTATNVIASMVNKLLIGPYTAFYAFLPSPIGSGVISEVDNLLYSGQQSLQAYLTNTFENVPGINDMKPGSSFLNTLNQNTSNTLSSAHYAIYGAETIHTPWHLLGSTVYEKSDGTEGGQAIKIHDTLESIYLTATVSALGAAQLYQYLRDRARHNYNFEDYFRYDRLYKKFQAVASAFNVGYYSLAVGDQIVWKTYVSHSLIPDYFTADGFVVPDTVYAADGILSADTQAPEFFGSLNDRRLQALGANHLEETAHINVRHNLEEVFQKNDVNITTGGTGGGDDGGGGGLGGGGDECIADNDGNCINF